MAFSESQASPAVDFISRFRDLPPAIGVEVVLGLWDQLSVLEQAAITHDFSFWARPKQHAPAGNWRTWGHLTGRGTGKTWAISHFINGEVEARRHRLICLLAQDEQSSIDIQVTGPSGLIATAHPKRRPVWEASNLQLVWPNGARAYVRTPEVPGKIRGLEYDLSWVSELQSHPPATRAEAWGNVEHSTRVGQRACIVWDATPKPRHPILKARLADCEANPEAHRLTKASTGENAMNLSPAYIADLRKKYYGTQWWRQEWEGEWFDEAEGALFRQKWIDDWRRTCPKLVRRVIAIDPAVSDRPGSDETGVVEAGLGVDGRVYVLGNETRKYADAGWAQLVLDRYVRNEIDLVLAETNKGGNLVVSTLRSLGALRGLEIIEIKKDERAPQRQHGKVFLRGVHARGSKEERAVPCAIAYERGRVSHVVGADLSSLEDTLTTWEPAPNVDSPGDLDALVHACVELLQLSNNEPDPKQAFQGITEAARQVAAAPTPTSLATTLTSLFRSRDRI